MTTHYEVKVFGQTFTLASDKGEEQLQTLAAAAERRLKAIARQTKTITPLRVAIMALLQVEEELLEAREKGLK